MGGQTTTIRRQQAEAPHFNEPVAAAKYARLVGCAALALKVRPASTARAERVTHSKEYGGGGGGWDV